MEAIPSLILDAKEIVEYVFHFQAKKLLIVLFGEQSPEQILPDLLFLNTSKVPYALLRISSEPIPAGWAERLKNFDLTLRIWEEPRFKVAPIKLVLPFQFLSAAEAHPSGLIFAWHARSSVDLYRDRLAVIFALAEKWAAEKIIFFSGSFHNPQNEKISHCTREEISVVNIAEAPMENGQRQFFPTSVLQQKLLAEILKNSSLQIDLVCLDFKIGNLFQELFTLAGSGTLISATYQSLVRKAQTRDLPGIVKLISTPMLENKLTKLDWVSLRENLHQGFVYEIETSIVGFAMIKTYAPYGELSKFCTFPRYQGRGIAQKLATTLLDEARKMQLAGVFALSIDPKLGKFFQNLGFQPTPRENLPSSWQKDYDFKRSSQAYLLKF